jgi:predicted RNA-binding Zn-ribbon protein involved in translation (DUF1610 family)
MQEIIYGGRYLGSFGSHGSLAMSTNPHNVHRQKFSSFKRCPLTFKRDHTMSQNNSAPSAQAPIVLNLQTLAKVMQWLERAQNHAGNLALQFSGHESALELTEIECEIATAYDLLSHIIMSGVKATPILCDTAGCDVPVNPNNAPPKGYEQVCLCCGNRDFKAAALFSYRVCPQCNTDVIYRCRYVAIAGSE